MVHHIDGRRDHNCPSNLLLMDACMHDSAQGRRLYSWMAARQTARAAFESGDDAPDWVTSGEFYDDGVALEDEEII